MSTSLVVLPAADLEALIEGAVTRALAKHVDDDAWMDAKAAATYAGCHVDTIRKAAKAGHLLADQEGDGHKLYVKRSDVDAWRAGRA